MSSCNVVKINCTFGNDILRNYSQKNVGSSEGNFGCPNDALLAKTTWCVIVLYMYVNVTCNILVEALALQ